MGYPSLRGVVGSLWLVGAAACDPDPSTVVTVHMLDRADHGVSGVTVYGHDAAGSRVDEDTTGGDGRVFMHVDAGGSVTTRRPGPNGDSWYSIFDVAPGDDILVRAGQGEAATRQITLDVPSLPATATGFAVTAPCVESSGRMGAALTLTIDADCPERGTMVLTAYDADNTNVGYLVMTDVDLTSAVTASGAWQPPSQTFEVTVTGFPATGGSVGIERGALVDGYPVAWTDVWLTTTTSTGTVTGFHPGVGDSVVYRMRQSTGSFCDERGQTYTRSRASDAAQFTVDVSDLMAPIGGVTFAPSQMSWMGGGGGVGIYASVTAAEGSGDVQSGAERFWGVVAPPGTTSIHFPTDVGYIWPSGNGDRVIDAVISETDSTFWASYADLRQNHMRAPSQIAGDFTTRSSSIAQAFGYIGCQPQP